ncbi:amino acid permease [Pseudonocardia eucalypti]|uniref:Amino acid permease n=1 Tax=Pseudonocardia eucalypti TaxID=648755 RepID=A0ABP9QLH3_9PSEU|nr:amino acid transporter [Pseudonocardia eucalypti]
MAVGDERTTEAAATEPKLRRVLGLPALLFFGLAYMVPLTVWTTYGVVTTSTQGHLPAAYIVTTVAMLFTAHSYGRMVVAQPIAGSAYSYASASFGRPVGFMVGWAMMLDYILLPMINYLVIGLYLAPQFPAVPQAAWIVLAVLLVTGLNILGVRLLAGMNAVLVAVQFVFIGVFAALVVAHLAGGARPASYSAPFLGPGADAGLITAGAAILALSFLGFDAVSTLSEETRDPRARIPKAILLCALVGGVVYVFQSYLGHLAFPDFARFADHQDVASSDVMIAVGGDLLNAFFTACFVAAAFACAMASQASVSRVLFAMGRDGSLPRGAFARLHPRFRTPVVANLVAGLFGLSALFVDLATASSIISFGALVAFLAVNLTVIKHYVVDGGRRSGPDLVNYGLLPLLGVLVTFWLWTQLSGLTWEIGLVWLVLGFAYLLWLTRLFRREPPPMYTGD